MGQLSINNTNTMKVIANYLMRYNFFFLLFLSVVTKTEAQVKTMDSSALAAAKEMTNIALAGSAYDNKQFDMSVINSDGIVADTISGTCSIQGDNYRCVFDSVQQIQNNFLNLEIHSDGKIFVVSHPVSFTKQFFKGNIDEAVFQQMNVGSLGITNVGSNKKLTFNFLTESEYNAYSIIYDPNSYRVLNVYLQTKVADYNGNYSTTNFITTNITFQNFVALTAGAVSFDTSPYIYIGANNVIQKQSAYTDYQVINLLNE